MNTDKSYYENKLCKLREALSNSNEVSIAARAFGMSDAAMRSALMENDASLLDFVKAVGKRTPNVSFTSVTYAAIVSLICDKLGVHYKVYASTSFDRNAKGYEKQVAGVKLRNKIFNHVFLEVEGGNGVYQYFFGGASDIDCVYQELISRG